MLGKFNAERLNSTVKNLKRQGQYAISALGKRYKEAKDIANTVDRYMNQARRIHSDLQPTINEAGGERGKQINDKEKKHLVLMTQLEIELYTLTIKQKNM